MTSVSQYAVVALQNAVAHLRGAQALEVTEERSVVAVCAIRSGSLREVAQGSLTMNSDDKEMPAHGFGCSQHRYPSLAPRVHGARWAGFRCQSCQPPIPPWLPTPSAFFRRGGRRGSKRTMGRVGRFAIPVSAQITTTRERLQARSMAREGVGVPRAGGLQVPIR